jgi:hypothetical protein
MSDADRERRLQRIESVFNAAIQRVDPAAHVVVNWPPNSGSARVIVSVNKPSRLIKVTFSISARDGITAASGESVIAGIPNLSDERAPDVIATVIKNAVAKRAG